VTLTGAPGKVNVTLTWDALPGAIKYALTGLGIMEPDGRHHDQFVHGEQHHGWCDLPCLRQRDLER
jgi:hypothetical protein